MEINCRDFNQKLVELSKNKKNSYMNRNNDEDIDDFNQMYNKELILMVQNKTISGSTDSLHLPGTICGDERMYKQFSRYLEKDCLNQTKENVRLQEQNSMNLDPRSVQSRRKNSNTYEEYYNNLRNDVINKSQEIGNFEAYQNKPNQKIEDQIK